MSTSSSPVATPSGKLIQAIHKHPIFFYFLMAFAFSWAYEVIAYGFFHP